jgi:hypothetical protein
MKDQNYTATLTVGQTPEEAFAMQPVTFVCQLAQVKGSVSLVCMAA